MNDSNPKLSGSDRSNSTTSTTDSARRSRPAESVLTWVKSNQAEYVAAARPDVILLDLNLPRKDGREVLAEIKQDTSLGRIPVVILTTSSADQDILKAYDLHANCYITKPVDLDQFIKVVRSIEDFWLTIVTFAPSVL